MATYTGALLEFYVPCVKFEGLKTNKDVSVGDGATVTLPSTTTIGGSAVVALGDITSSSTSATAFTVTNTGIFVGTGGVVAITANSATSPTSIFVITANGITSGGVGLITSTGTLVTTASLLTLTANSATTAAGIFRVNANGLTTGAAAVISSTGVIATSGRLLTLTATGLTTGIALDLGTLVALTTGVGINIAHTTSVIADGGSLVRLASSSVDTGGATNGTILDIGSTGQTAGTVVKLSSIMVTGTVASITSTGVMTTTGNLLTLTANSATTGGIAIFNGTGLTTGKGLVINATSATLTTGFYLACNDATGNVFTVGSNGHLTSNLGGGTAPVMTTNATGISATAIVAGSTDVCGSFTTTGTPASGTVLTLTFHKTYTVAPKFAVVSPINAAAANPNTLPTIATTATTITFTWPAGGTYAATPSYSYFVVA